MMNLPVNHKLSYMTESDTMIKEILASLKAVLKCIMLETQTLCF